MLHYLGDSYTEKKVKTVAPVVNISYLVIKKRELVLVSRCHDNCVEFFKMAIIKDGTIACKMCDWWTHSYVARHNSDGDIIMDCRVGFQTPTKIFTANIEQKNIFSFVL